MKVLIKELEQTAILSKQDGVVLDFRNSETQLFMVDKAGKVLKPNRKYKISIELVEDKANIK